MDVTVKEDLLKKSFLFMCVSDCGFVQVRAVSSELRSESISPL